MTVEADEDVMDQAAAWRLRVDSADWSAADEAELRVWLEAHEANAEAFAATGAVWDFFDDNAAEPELMRARRDAIDRAGRAAGRRWSGPGRFMPRSGLQRMAAAVALAAVLGAGVYPLADGKTTYSSGRGERRVVTLEDGSRVSLDALTKVSVRYSKDVRRLTLVEGQARFDVAKDPARPFAVRAGDRTVLATGTAFNIDMLAPELKVTLIEGKVLVLTASEGGLLPAPNLPKAQPVELAPGQQLVAAGQGARVKVADVSDATAWQIGKLIFDDEPLEAAAQRVNRYASRPVVVGDDRARQARVSGVFDAGDVDAFVGAVTYYLPVEAEERSDRVVLVGKANG